MAVGQDSTVFVSTRQIPVVCTAGHDSLGFESRIHCIITEKKVKINFDRSVLNVSCTDHVDLLSCLFVHIFIQSFVLSIWSWLLMDQESIR